MIAAHWLIGLLRWRFRRRMITRTGTNVIANNPSLGSRRSGPMRTNPHPACLKIKKACESIAGDDQIEAVSGKNGDKRSVDGLTDDTPATGTRILRRGVTVESCCQLSRRETSFVSV